VAAAAADAQQAAGAAAAQQAFKSGKLAFGFSAGGLLFPVRRTAHAVDRQGFVLCGNETSAAACASACTLQQHATTQQQAHANWHLLMR
jgi:hypothetical protein